MSQQAGPWWPQEEKTFEEEMTGCTQVPAVAEALASSPERSWLQQERERGLQGLARPHTLPCERVTERITSASSPCVSTYDVGAEHRPRSSELCEGKSSKFAEHCSIGKYLLGTLCLLRYIWYLLEESRGR